MNTHTLRRPLALAALASLCGLYALGAIAEPPRTAGASLVGGAVPGAGILSARSVILVPAGGGAATAVPLAADGSFRAEGLSPGHYSLRLSSVTVPRQTQGATFGEKVQAGLSQAGSAVASGAARSGTPPASAAVSGAQAQRDSMPSRLSMNVTVPKQTSRLLDVAGAGADVEVAVDGMLSGAASAAR
jgi:hypothetical protein